MINDGSIELTTVETEQVQLDVYLLLEQLGISKAKWVEHSMSVMQDAVSGE
ncbi:MAG TPA: hypothetical protein VMS09_11490 [Paenibacillus sp.]|uniref:hypothetical protein n=1 Tax=Paenibacillus sp. TaxID=58172 RepID=UPI0028D48B91|nr:hypothetical protein [Paenibacillus sp.]HUC92640.1 hypothetical protein [Paenibacillus sp.]